MTQEFIKRNRKIYRDWQKNPNYRQIALKYGLDIGYVWRLIQRYQKQEVK